MSVEERLYSLAAQLKMLEAYMNDLLAREDTIVRFIQDARLAMEAIRGLDSKEGDDLHTFMPIGVGVYVHARVNTKERLLVSVGSGIAIEKGRDDAIAYIETRVRELEGALVSIGNQKQELQARIESIRGEMNSIMQQMQQKQVQRG
ncbi:MAG: prefoldin subunit alpha [Candidatus Nitrosocaldus sp.]|nr:prefoldin subunit alpha [Candidatus Nitrosocaldus sp.]MDW8000249.1 prefoldin subunit alpha [Candidatus Nitrosocaldus sp.]